MEEKISKFWALYYHIKQAVKELNITQIRHSYRGEELEAAIYFKRLSNL